MERGHEQTWVHWSSKERKGGRNQVRGEGDRFNKEARAGRIARMQQELSCPLSPRVTNSKSLVLVTQLWHPYSLLRSPAHPTALTALQGNTVHLPDMPWPPSSQRRGTPWPLMALHSG